MSRETLGLITAEQVTISQIEVIPLEPSHPDEWYIVEAGSTSLIPIEVADLSVAPEEAFDFSVFFRPIESGPRSAVVVITWGDAHRYTVQVNARGRDNATLSPVIRAEADYLYSKRPANTLMGGGVNAGDAFCFGQNVNEWSDTFSENIAVTCLNADGSLKWSKEFAALDIRGATTTLARSNGVETSWAEPAWRAVSDLLEASPLEENEKIAEAAAARVSRSDAVPTTDTLNPKPERLRLRTSRRERRR